MKVKRRREDFVVHEISDFALGDGPFATYRLEKSGIGTPEAVNEVLQIWKIPRKRLEYGGLKDRHAITTQTVTIYQGPQSSLEGSHFSLTYQGQAKRAFTARDIQANDFRIELRELEKGLASRLGEQAQSQMLCIPNYFDRQRFGSVGASGEFVAQPWCLGNYERAAYLALAEFNPNDGPQERAQKEIVREHWGDWQACKDRLERSNCRSVVTYLVDHPQGFKKAIALIRRDLRSLYVSAFQARLWNEVASRWIRSLAPATVSCPQTSPTGQLVFPIELHQDVRKRFAKTAIPLPSGRPTAWDPEIHRLLKQVAGEFGLKVHQLRFSHPRDVYFARGRRNVLLVPTGVQADCSEDEFSRSGNVKLTLQFRLQAGQYATMFILGLQQLAEQST